MTSKLKEDEKNEKTIRGLLKQSGNRKCINCNVLGPQYVCITFSTFVCATCSGMHREFSHRVKSVSMAKFTPEEIASLKAGGNELAKGIFFKDLCRQHVKPPDGSNEEKLRNFIKHAYVDRRYTGEKSTERPPTGKMGDKEDPGEKRRSVPYHGDKPSPGHDVRKGPGHDKDSQRQSHHGISPSPPGIVSNWHRKDRFSNGKKSVDGSDEAKKPEISSPQKDSSISSLPAADLLGENVQPLQISAEEGSVIAQATASSSSLVASFVNPTEHKSEISLIDFDVLPEPAVTAAVTEVQQTATGQSIVQSTSTPIDDDWGIFGNVQTPCITNQLDSVSGISSGGGATTPSNGTFPSSSSSDFLADHGMASGPSLAPTVPVNGGGAQWHMMQNPQQPPYAAVDHPVAPQLGSAFHSGLSSQAMVVAQTPEANAQRSRELPMDLFTATYSNVPYQGPAWQTGQLHGMGYPAQYNTAMSAPTFSQQIKPPNPFNANGEASPSQAAAFPSMSSMHAALPNMAVHGGSGVPFHGSPAIQGAYMGQQLHSNKPPSRPHGVGSYAYEGTHFGSLNPIAPTSNPALGGNPFG